ncbi:hypothetical protein D3C85_1550410 [compost metagenome]
MLAAQNNDALRVHINDETLAERPRLGFVLRAPYLPDGGARSSKKLQLFHLVGRFDVPVGVPTEQNYIRMRVKDRAQFLVLDDAQLQIRTIQRLRQRLV